MTTFKKTVISCYGFFLCILSLVSTPVFADQLGNVRIYQSYNEEFISGGQFSIYQVAKSNQDATKMILDDAFTTDKTKTLDLSEASVLEHSAQYAELFSGLTAGAEPLQVTEEVGKDGVFVQDLEAGLYLFVQSRAAQGYQNLKPFLVSLPAQGRWSIVVKEKMSPVSQTPPETTPKPGGKLTYEKPKLPFTGQVWWPAFALSGLGLVCFVYSFKKEKHDGN